MRLLDKNVHLLTVLLAEIKLFEIKLDSFIYIVRSKDFGLLYSKKNDEIVPYFSIEQIVFKLENSNGDLLEKVMTLDLLEELIKPIE